MNHSNVFILAQHRTGSTLLKNILGAHSKVHFAFDEMNLFEPFRKNTLDRIISHNHVTPAQLGSLIKEKQIYGTFWKDFEESGIKIDELVHHLNQTGTVSLTSVIDAVIQLLKEKNKVNIVGIKYPVHLSRIDFLVCNYPDSTIFFLTRNPSAIIASKLNDPATKFRKSRSVLHRLLIHYFTIIYFALEFNKSQRIFHKFRSKVKLVVYEQLVLQKKDTVNGICERLNIEFENQMLSVSGKPSSLGLNADNTISDGSVKIFKSVLSKFDVFLIRVITWQSHKKFIDAVEFNF